MRGLWIEVGGLNSPILPPLKRILFIDNIIIIFIIVQLKLGGGQKFEVGDQNFIKEVGSFLTIPQLKFLYSQS